MFRRTNEEYTDEKDIKRQNVHWLIVAGDEGEGEHDGYEVGKEVLYRRRIQARKGNRRGKAVMELMVGGVESRTGKYAVDVVLQYLAGQVPEYEMTRHFPEGGRSRRYDEDWTKIG